MIVFLGYAVVQLPFDIAAKFSLLLAGSIAITLGLYHFAVRPYGPMRFLAGMGAGGRESSREPSRPCYDAAALERP